MSGGRNASIDQLIRREHLRTLGFWAAGLSLVSVILAVAFLARFPGDTREVSAVVVGVVGTPAEEGHRLYLRAVLDSGAEVRARVHNKIPVIQGRRAVLAETDSQFSRRRTYRFLRYEAAQP